MPTSAEEVSAAVKFCVSTHTPLTVAGGRHSSSGTSSTHGMVIDLSKMRKVDINKDALTVTFGGGCIWKDLDEALVPLGLATVGGIVNHTGVGGLILGGGHGYLTAKYGLTIDILISAEIVTADGSIREVSNEQNQDLFWAIRGAGAQFGVVTHFTSRVFPQGLVWSGLLTYDAAKIPEVVEAANEFLSRDNRHGHCMTIGIGYMSDGQTRAVNVIPLYHGSESDGREFFSALLQAGPLHDRMRMLDMREVNALLNPIVDHGIRRLMGSGNAISPLSTTALSEAAETFWKFCDAHPGMGSESVLAVELWPTHKIREVPQQAMAYANRGNYFDAITILGWRDPEWDASVRTFNRGLVTHLRERLGYRYQGQDADGVAPVGRYINLEADPVRPEDAYGANLARLRDLKRKYDAGNVFHKWHGIYVAAE